MFTKFPSRIFLLLFSLLTITACADAERQPSRVESNTGGATIDADKQPGDDVVRASATEARVVTGAEGEAVVIINVAEGFHVNANPASDKYLIATEVTITQPAEGITVGAPVYPAGETKKFDFSEKPLSVYEGAVTIRLPLKADARASKGPRTLGARVTAQPCNDTMCFDRRTINADIPLVIE